MYPLNDAAACISAVAESVGHSMGGSSGALYQILFVAMAGQQLSIDSVFCYFNFCGISFLLLQLLVARDFAADLAESAQKGGRCWWRW